MKKNLLKTGISLLILVITLVVVETQIGWIKLLTSWEGFAPLTLALLVVLSLASNVLRAVRIKISFELPLNRFSDMFYLSTSHNLLNNLLPMRTGEVAFPVLIKRHFSIGLLESGSHLLLYRLLDLVALLSIAAVLIIWQYSIPAALGFALLVMLGLWLFDRAKGLGVKLLCCFSHSKLLKLADAIEALPTRGHHFSAIVITTYAIWMTKLLAFLGVVLQLSELTLAQAVTSVAIADLSSILPIHGVAGSGTFEAAFVLAGKLYGTDTTALLTVAVQLHLFLLLMSFVAWGLGWLIAKLSPRAVPVS
ncbi:MAG: flippase-like domain-containing protein [Amphritea sp.]|nr:flippase-like domain-containing protein [Amphritea sp.]